MEKKILVCWDGSKQSRNALKYAIDVAKEKNLQKVTAVLVEENKNKRIEDMLKDYAIEIDEEILKEKHSFVDSVMEEARALGADEGIEVETQVIKRVHSPAVDIVKFAEENEFCHIIVGSHGRSGISRIALGSVAEAIAKKGHCIVTIVKCDWPS